jgi:hypothetical protein
MPCLRNITIANGEKQLGRGKIDMGPFLENVLRNNTVPKLFLDKSFAISESKLTPKEMDSLLLKENTTLETSDYFRVLALLLVVATIPNCSRHYGIVLCLMRMEKSLQVMRILLRGYYSI